MKSRDEVVRIARTLGDELRSELKYVAGSTSSTSAWWALDRSQLGRIRARGTTGLEFFRLYAGPESEWYKRASATLTSEGRTTPETRVVNVAELLEQWATQVEAGVCEIAGTQAAGVRDVASTDLMEQVRALMAERSVHPAAPIVLAGAAVEIALRSAAEEHGVPVTGHSGISSYGTALRSAGLISKQDMKDIEQLAGLRNAAAHGDFDELSRERAGLMEQQANLVLAKLTQLLDS